MGRPSAAATTLNDGGTPVRLLLTLAVPADEVVYGVFEAQSPELVTQLCAQARLPAERLTSDIRARLQNGFDFTGTERRLDIS